MRALVLTDWWNLSVEEVPTPPSSDRDVMIRVLATGICGSDIHGFTGENGRRRFGQVMGHETVGEVVSIGPSAEVAVGVRVGATVTVNPVLACGACSQCAAGAEQACPNRIVIGVTPSIVSAFAEYMVVRDRNVVALPPSVPAEFGALVEPLAVGLHAARRGEVTATDKVLVIGGGPIGQASVLACAREGVTQIVVSEPNSKRHALLKTIGATVVDPGDEDFAETVTTHLGGRPTVVLDAVGSTPSLDAALNLCDSPGRVVLVGMGSPKVELSAYQISTVERTVIGSFCYSAAEFADTARWLGETDLPIEALIEGRVDLEAGNEAFAALARGESDASKILVFPNGLE